MKKQRYSVNYKFCSDSALITGYIDIYIYVICYSYVTVSDSFPK